MGITSHLRLSSLICSHLPNSALSSSTVPHVVNTSQSSLVRRPLLSATRSTCLPSPFCSSSRSAPRLPSTTTSPPPVAKCTTRYRATPTRQARRTGSRTSPVTRDPLLGRGLKRNCEAFLTRFGRWQLLGVCRLGMGCRIVLPFVIFALQLSVAIAYAE